MGNLSTQFDPVYHTDYGTARVTPSGYISNVSVRVRGQGHGTELMQKVTQHADEMGKSLTMHARPELHPWYQRLGFTHTADDEFGPRLERSPKGK